MAVRFHVEVPQSMLFVCLYLFVFVCASQNQANRDSPIVVTLPVIVGH